MAKRICITHFVYIRSTGSQLSSLPTHLQPDKILASFQAFLSIIEACYKIDVIYIFAEPFFRTMHASTYTHTSHTNVDQILMHKKLLNMVPEQWK